MIKTLGPTGKPTNFQVHFSELQDPRKTNKGNFQHLLSDILFLTISAMICGASEWPMVKTFGKTQLGWLR